jgi:hypothetical protein
MKYAIYGICGFFFFLYLFGPAIFDAMKKKDYNDLYQGLKQTRIDNGSYHEGPRSYQTYEEKLMKRR